MLNFLGTWAKKVSLIEIVCNDSYRQSLEMFPFEELYGRKFWSPIQRHEAGERKFLGLDEGDAVSREIETIKRRL